MKRTIEVSEDTYQKIKEQFSEVEVLDINSLGDMVGKSFFFRTVTYHQVGRVVKVVGNLVQLEEASWVADSGRFMQAIKEGKLNEVEPVGSMFVSMAAVVDICPWNHPLPKEQI
ncbi:MAG: hypothetical protein GY937_09220 [bacterium]|nr:hypothetical protein [bacterium]